MEKQRVYRPLLFLLCSCMTDVYGVGQFERGLTEEKKQVMIHIYEQILIC